MIALLLGIPVSAWAAPVTTPVQESSDTGDVAARFEVAFDSVGTLDQAIAAMDRWSVGTTGDDRRLLAQRRRLRVETRRALIGQLAELVADLPADRARARRVRIVDSLLAGDAAALRAETLGVMASASALRESVTNLEGAERAKRERQLEDLDRAIQAGFAAYSTTLSHRKALGSDVGAALAALDDNLRMRAEILAARMAATEDDIAALRERLERKETGLEPEVAALERRASGTASALKSVLDLMDERGLETAEFRRYLLVTTGELTAEQLSWDVASGLLAAWASQVGVWVRDNGANVVFKLLLFLAILAAFWIAARIVRRLLTRALGVARVGMSGLLREALVQWTARAIMLLGVLIALSQVGVQLGPVLAGLGVAGFIVGFALQESLSNLAAGVMILFYRPFDVNDWVEVGGALGKVSDMSLVSTTILSPDNQRYIVPNNKIWGDVIRNITAQDIRRVDLVFGIGYRDDIPKAEQVLSDIVKRHKLVLDEPAPAVKVSKLNDSSVDFVVRPWCKVTDYWEVYFDITRTVKLRFDEEGISIPFPQRDVHLYGEGGKVAGDNPSQRAEAPR